MWFSTSQLLQWSSLNQYILIQPIRSAVLPRECPNPLILALSQFSGQFRNDFLYYVTCSAWLSKQTVTRADTPVTFEKQPVHMVLITSAMSSRRSSEIWLGASLLPRTLLLSWTGVWPHWLSGSGEPTCFVWFHLNNLYCVGVLVYVSVSPLSKSIYFSSPVLFPSFCFPLTGGDIPQEAITVHSISQLLWSSV